MWQTFDRRGASPKVASRRTHKEDVMTERLILVILVVVGGGILGYNLEVRGIIKQPAIFYTIGFMLGMLNMWILIS